MKKRILFVDDEPNIIQGLKRALRCRKNEWEMFFADSGQKALELLAENQVDVIVTDMCMPGMDGVKLLTEVMKHYPRTARIILSGNLYKEMHVFSSKTAHKSLSKPCDTEKLIKSIEQVLENKEGLFDNSF
jgi:YesN/AraC family two-component response regulator